jgi:hypothetical protein
VQGPHTTQATHKGVIDHLRKRSGESGIKRITALLKYFGTHLGSARLRTHDDPFHLSSCFFDPLNKN